MARELPSGSRIPRREVLKALSAAGVTSAVFGRAVVALADPGQSITPAMIARAEWISGITLTDKQRKLMIKDLSEAQKAYAKLRAVRLDNSVPPALVLELRPGSGEGSRVPRGAAPPARDARSDTSQAARGRSDTSQGRALQDVAGETGTEDRDAAPTRPDSVAFMTAEMPRRPSSDDDLAFASVTRLAALLQTGQASSVELTRLYLERLRRLDPRLQCVITLTETLALEQAEKADRERADGHYRGPLHGIPWGVKDLLSVPGYPTTWGATPFKEQYRPEKATVVRRIEEAGGVLLAKLTVGELAWGDVWFGGTTKNPWKLDQGSSGSSAGSASATAAGLVGFAIGTETWGSIVSPCTRCGVTGLRPTFGRVSRYGAMALAWSMDKIGPIARSAEDCALIFHAIHGPDERDPSVKDQPFHWPPARDPRVLKVGYTESLFADDYTKWADTEDEKPGLREWQELDRAALETLRGMGVTLVPIALPSTYPVNALSIILTSEAATAFDELTRTGKDALLVRQVADAWPNVFRQGQLIPAVEYLRANRIRTLLIQEMDKLMSEVDVYVAPSFGGDNLLLTNLTGHPAVVLPDGFRKSDGTPTSITFTGRLYGEAEVLGLAHAFQQATDFHLKRPPVSQLAARESKPAYE